MASKQNNISRYAGKIESRKNVYGKINFSFIWRLCTTTTIDFDSWSIHADSWIWLCALPLGNVLLYTSTFHTFSFCSFSDSRMSPCGKCLKKYVCDITWLQVIDLHIKNDYDSVIAFHRFHSGQWRQQRINSDLMLE